MKQFISIDDIPLSFGPLELAKILGISRTKAYEVVNTPGFPMLKVGKKIIIIKDYFLKWQDSQISNH